MKTKTQIQQEALDAIGDHRRSGVELSMAVGKCLLGLKHMSINYTDVAKNLVVAPKKSIFRSWIDETSLWKMEYLIPHITFSTYRSLNKQDFDYDTIYLDECQSLTKGHNEWLKEYVKRGGRIVGLTGTYPDKKSSEKGKMCNFYCPKVYEYLTDDAIDDNILNDYEIFVHELPLDTKPTLVKKGKHGEWKSSELKDYQYWSDRVGKALPGKQEQIARIQRMSCLKNFPSKEYYAKKLFDDQVKKVMIFANTKAQADRLCTHSYHSSNDDSEYNLTAFKKGDIMKMSAVEQLNEGITIYQLTIGIIMHSYGNDRKARQKLGRFLRLNVNDKATLHILCYVNSVDKEWVTSALAKLDQSKIKWIKPKYYAGLHY